VEALKRRADELGVPTRWVSREEVASKEHGVHADSVLESPETGIVDAHGVMLALAGELEAAGGTLVTHSPVEGLERLNGGGWKITIAGEPEPVTASTITITAGLDAIRLANLLQSDDTKKRTAHYAKGNYFSYHGPLRPKRLLYPAPSSDPGFAGLGTHLTLDLGGGIRFGPDIEWLDESLTSAATAFDPANSEIYKPNADRLPEAVQAVQRYLPSLEMGQLQLDYAGIRPKMVGPGHGFEDFRGAKVEGAQDAVECLGIESPGLTSSLAIGREVERLHYG
jgi:2-hydroxyglutarate dehydrogenase